MKELQDIDIVNGHVDGMKGDDVAGCSRDFSFQCEAANREGGQ